MTHTSRLISLKNKNEMQNNIGRTWKAKSKRMAAATYLQKMELEGVVLKTPMVKDRTSVKEVTVIALPASRRVADNLFSGGSSLSVSCHAPSITYASSTPIASARNGITVT